MTGVDAAEPLVELARKRTPEGDFRSADLEALPFLDHTFDLVTGFNAFQYAGNPMRAVAEAGRVARPGGMVAIMVWGEPADMPMAAVITALAKLMPPPPPGSGGPFALSDGDALRRLARQAGLSPVDLLDVVAPITYPDLLTALRGLNSSGVAARVMALVGEEAVSRAHAEALAPFQKRDGSIEIGATFRCLICTP